MKKNKLSKVSKLLFCILMFATGQLHAEQFCLSTAAVTAPEDEFLKFDNGQVLHLSTNLMWMRCSLGQTWTGDECTGEALSLTWKEALNMSVGYEFNESNGWRLPNVKELASITERSCARPSINISLFPNTLEDDYWSSTPSLTDPQRAWVVAFFNSSNSIKEKDRAVFVRLVRTATRAERELE
ncbi:DUF1566 domain-containing protein [Glaciecola sp. MH2013]|uniref:Lcl C-terminal domain-containing protein n=1 Tax=Glaciecola sp. MH2013 TaxID=2785524 RepID=UPI00189FACD6|nr:DUF1566 domain-containing protein [Glaciecola sp. MH2013]MBF7074838.1 DUF1566 domain-containing protein [Glaciecola sp. MH2013]